MMSRRALRVQRIVMFAGLAVVAFVLSRAISTILDYRFGDFPCFYWAAHAVVQGQDVHESGHGGYIYPPLLAFLFRPLTFWSLSGAAMVWLFVNVASLVCATILGAREAIRRFGPVAAPHAVWVVAAGALLLTADKYQASVKQGQTDGLVLLGFVLGLQWLERRPALAGLALGFAANIKYLSILALPYLLFRRRWAAAAWMIAGTVGWALLPALALGWSENLDALRQAASGLVRAVGVDVESSAANVQGIDWHLSVSIGSMVSRMLGPEAPVAFKGAVTLVLALFMLNAVWTVFEARGQRFVWPRRDELSEGTQNRITALEWAGLIVAPLAFGPQTAGRHLVIMLLVHAMAVAVLLGRAPARRKRILVAGLVVFQLGMLLPPGEPYFDYYRNAWRSVGGASWCMLAMYLTLLWAGLPDRAGPEPAPTDLSPPPRPATP